MREDILNKLKNMRLSSMSEAYINQVNNPNSDLRPFEERFEEIVDAEWNARYNKKLNRFIKKATLKYPGADFDESIYDTDRLLDTRTIEALTSFFLDSRCQKYPYYRIHWCRQDIYG